MRTLDKDEMAVVAGGLNVITGGNNVGQDSQMNTQMDSTGAFPVQQFNSENIAATPQIFDTSGTSSRKLILPFSSVVVL
jgi:hypothetical protein